MSDIKYTFTQDEDNELDQLIERFKSNDEYFAYIQRQVVTHILSENIKDKKKPTAELRLLDLVKKTRY